MLKDIPQNLVLMAAGCFLLGWILGSISARIAARARVRKRDPRDDRIRSMEADLRVGQIKAQESDARIVSLEKHVKQADDDIVKRDSVITHQQLRLEEIKKDLQDSVKKTRELRNELTDRAAESVRSEVKLREVETELSVAHASTDFIATGILDYEESQRRAAADAPKESPKPAKVSKNLR